MLEDWGGRPLITLRSRFATLFMGGRTSSDKANMRRQARVPRASMGALAR